MSEPVVQRLPAGTKRAPGGNFYSYSARDPVSGEEGFGQTEREARRDLEKKVAAKKGLTA